jgi:hypothetical protein
MISMSRGKHLKHRTRQKGASRPDVSLRVRSRDLNRTGTIPSRSVRPGAVVLLMASAVMLCIATCGFLGSPSSAAQSPRSGATQEASANCPGGVSQCVTFTMPCGSSSCPEITAGPTLNIGPNEYVYLSMSNFTVGDDARIALCPVAKVPQVGSNPSCASGVDPEGVSLSQISVPANSSGALGASFPTVTDPSNEGNSPITATKLISTIPADPSVSSFYCDNSPDYCALFVQEYPEYNDATPLIASDTVVVPLSFAPALSGCPSSDPLIYTDSAFSLEHFLPAAVDSTCGEKGGVAALDTSTDTGQVVQDFAAGGTTIAFTDAPQDPSEVSGLKPGSYEFIPIAVSATVVAFLGGYDPGTTGAYPIPSYNLTPNMVAGVLVGNYLQPYGSDVLMPPLICKEIFLCGPGQENNYDGFDLLNPAPEGSYGPQQYGSFFSSVDTGASYQVTDWACSAPNVPFKVTVLLKKDGKPVPTSVPVLDSHTAEATLTTPEVSPVWPPAGDPTAKWPYQTCQPYSTLPALSAESAQYSFSETEDLQANALRGFAYSAGVPYQTSGGQTRLGFGAMDWSEASYFGLNSANLQNPYGNFVAPSAGSIDDALGDATTLPDGVLSYNYDDTTDPNDYPMPLVTYALVSTAHVPAAQSQAEGDLLTNLACYSYSGGTIALPTGYVPLTETLYQQALGKIQKAFPYTKASCDAAPPTLPSSSSPSKKSHPSSTTTTTTTHHSTAPPTSGSGVGTTSRPSSSTTPTSPASRAPVVATLGTASAHLTPTPTPKAPGPTPIPGREFVPVVLALAEGAERWIVSGLAVIAVAGLVIGPLIFLWPRVRQRFARSNSGTQ